jgi:hypothetical protein
MRLSCAVLVSSSLASLVGCGRGSSTDTAGSAGALAGEGPGVGGSSYEASAGASPGGASSGGSPAGGTRTGGSHSGGSRTGGSHSGGRSSGQSGADAGDSGGSATGGRATGGAGTGGTATGGASTTGGAGTGGMATGGASTTGGAGTGGMATGGASTTGGAGGAGSAGCVRPDPGTNPNRVCIKGKSYYLNGINVAWGQWTADLIDYDAAQFEGLFSTLERSKGNAIRWWWFIDGEKQLTFQSDLVQPLPQSIFDNLDVAFEAAAKHGILIMPVFLSFDIENTGRTFLVTNEAATDAFVTNVVAPLVERYNDHPALGLWEIMNEGDWLLSDEGGTVSVADYQRFHGKVAAGIHAADADALVTTGSAMFKYLETSNNILADDALEAAAGGDPLAHLDVYQTHYYGWMHGGGWSYEPWIKTSSEWLDAGKPILIGEFPCRGEPGRWTSMQMHVESVAQGYAGTFCWAYFDNRADSEGTWTDAKPGVEAIAAQIPQAMTGE